LRYGSQEGSGGGRADADNYGLHTCTLFAHHAPMSVASQVIPKESRTNIWTRKEVAELPDGRELVTYFNQNGAEMLRVVDGDLKSAVGTKYHADFDAVLVASDGAVASTDESLPYLFRLEPVLGTIEFTDYRENVHGFDEGEGHGQWRERVDRTWTFKGASRGRRALLDSSFCTKPEEGVSQGDESFTLTFELDRSFVSDYDEYNRLRLSRTYLPRSRFPYGKSDE
jgi:hypothetical protein